jgi:hypothetical protein
MIDTTAANTSGYMIYVVVVIVIILCKIINEDLIKCLKVYCLF